MEITIRDIENNSKTLPKSLFQSVNDYIEFLKLKYREDNVDWADQLSESQLRSIENGISDIKNGNTLTHEEAKQKIRDYLKTKTL